MSRRECCICPNTHLTNEMTVFRRAVSSEHELDAWAGTTCIIDFIFAESRERIYVSIGYLAASQPIWSKGFSVTQSLATLKAEYNVSRSQIKDLKCYVLPRGAYDIRVSNFGEPQWKGGGAERAMEVNP